MSEYDDTARDIIARLEADRSTLLQVVATAHGITVREAALTYLGRFHA